jgi:radical SAM protein with 4Fe4S-binding SPASM domain
MDSVETKPGLPRNLYFEVTNRCNLKCKACILFKGSWESPRDITLDELIRITDQLPELEHIALHGIGEPLLNKDLPAMIRHLKKRDVVVLINSNGILLNDRQQNALIAAGLDELRISLDAASAQGYKAMRGSSQFDRIVDNLASLQKRIGQLKAARPRLSLWYLGTSKNISELPDFIGLAASIGVREVHLQRLVYFQDGTGYGVATPENTLMEPDGKFREFVNQSQTLAKQSGIQFNASGLVSPLESVRADSANSSPWKKCFRPITLMYITANGNVLPCCISPFSTSEYSSIILGNVFESGIKEIWLGSKYKKFRKAHQTTTPPGCCRGCGILWSL